MTHGTFESDAFDKRKNISHLSTAEKRQIRSSQAGEKTVKTTTEKENTGCCPIVT